MKKYFHTLIALLFMSTLALPAMAQPGPGGRGRRGQPPRGQAPAHKMKRAQKMIGKALRNKLGLSGEKARKVEAILKQHIAAQRKLKGQIRTARQDLGKLFRSDSNDQNAGKAALDKM